MIEKIFKLNTIDPNIFFGVNNANSILIKSHFKDLKIVSRDNIIKVAGEEKRIDLFTRKIHQVTEYIEKYNYINSENLLQILENEYSFLNMDKIIETHKLANKLSGQLIIAKTKNQIELIQSAQLYNMLFAIGPAGTGKTFLSIVLAVSSLKRKEVKRIVLTRPAIESGENIGFLPGDLKEKLDPYMQPLYDALKEMIPKEKLEYYISTDVVEIAPLGFMRGRTLDNAFVILDEAQNTTTEQMKMFLTRMGNNSKFIINGDLEQIDLPKNVKSGLIDAKEILNNIKTLKFIEFSENDVMRNPIVKNILKAYNKL